MNFVRSLQNLALLRNNANLFQRYLVAHRAFTRAMEPPSKQQKLDDGKQSIVKTANIEELVGRCTAVSDFLPASLRGSTQLDRDAFSRTIHVPFCRLPIGRGREFEKVTGTLKKLLLKLQKVKPFVTDGQSAAVEVTESGEKVDESQSAGSSPKLAAGSHDETKQLESIPASQKGSAMKGERFISVVLNVEKLKTIDKVLNDSERELLDSYCERTTGRKFTECLSVQELSVNYANFSYDDVVRSLLPGERNVTAFTQVGHIVHLNLRDAEKPYERVIAEVILDKLPTCKTVVVKRRVIENAYRTFDMDVVAGEKQLETRLREHGCTFELDFSRVYWNSRLSEEHRRVVDCVVASSEKGTAVLADLFCGIGPFVVPALRRVSRSYVIANDLNPDCVHWLQRNLQLNLGAKWKGESFERVRVSNVDAATYMTTRFANDLADFYRHSRQSDSGAFRVHVTMNLPEIAVTFLHHLVGLFAHDKLEPQILQEVQVHCYAFSRDADPVAHVRRMVVEELFGAAQSDATDSEHERNSFAESVRVREVRDVAPSKLMLCAEFRVPPSVLLRNSSQAPSCTTLQSSD